MKAFNFALACVVGFSQAIDLENTETKVEQLETLLPQFLALSAEIGSKLIQTIEEEKEELKEAE